MSDKARHTIVDDMTQLRIRMAVKKRESEKLLIESQEQLVLANHYESLLDQKREELEQHDKNRRSG